MNLLLIIVIIVLAGYTLFGYKEGLIRTVFSICSMLVALILTLLISPSISQALKEKENVVTFFSNQVEKVLSLDQKETMIDSQQKQIDELPLPESVKEVLQKNDNASAYHSLKVTDFTSYLSHSVAYMIINALSFIVTFLALLILLRILCRVLDLISKLPILNQINKLAGVIAGFIRGLIVIWLLCIVLTIFSGTNWGKAAFEMINESTILGLVYNNNLIINFVVDLTKSLL